MIPDESIFADDVTFEATGRTRLNFDSGIAYSGTLEGKLRFKLMKMFRKMYEKIEIKERKTIF